MSGWGGPWSSALRRIQIPQDAGPADPRIVITTEPPETIAGGNSIDAAILFYFNETDYFYLGVTGFGPNFGMLMLGADMPSTGGGQVITEWDAVPSTDETITTMWAGNGTDSARIYMDSEQIEINHDAEAGMIRLNAEGFNFGQSFDNVSLPRGTQEALGATGGTSFTTTELVVEELTSGVGTFFNGRRYRLDYAGSVRSTVAGDRVGIRIRQDDAAGTILRDCGEIVLGPANIPHPVDVWLLYSGRQTVNETVALCMRRTAGTGTITFTPACSMNNDQTDMTP